MKYLVELKYTNPSHEHVSLRRKVHSVNRIVEASNPEEAIFRATRQQRALGFMVSEAKVVDEQKPQTSTAETAEVLSEEVKKANFRIRSDDRDGNTHYITRTGGRMSSHNERGRMTALSNHAFRHPGGTEDAERAVRGALHKATNSEDAAARMNASGLGYSNWKPEAHDEDPSSWKYTNEDIEQVDEANMRFDYEAAARPKSSDVKNFLNRDKNRRAAAASRKYIRRMTKLGGLGPNQTKKDTEEHMKAHFEEVEQVDEGAATHHGVVVDNSRLDKPKNISGLARQHGGQHAYRDPYGSVYVFGKKDGAKSFKLAVGSAASHIKADQTRKIMKMKELGEDVEQVEEASKKEAPYLAQFVPNADAPMKDHLAFPVHSTDEKEAHRAFERTFGKKMKADYTLHGIFPADVNEEVEQVDEAGALLRKLVPGLGRMQAASRANRQRDIAYSFTRYGDIHPRDRGPTNPNDPYHHPNTAANRHFKWMHRYDKIAAGRANEEVELEESMTDSWKNVQSMPKGSVTGGEEEIKRRHAYLTAVYNHHKKYGNDTSKVRKEIESLNRSRVANEEAEHVDEETPARVIAAQKKFDLEAQANARNTEQAGSAAADRRAEIIRKAKEELAKRKSLAEAKKPDDKEKKIVVGGKGANKEKVSVTPSIPGDSPDSKPGTERN